MTAKDLVGRYVEFPSVTNGPMTGRVLRVEPMVFVDTVADPLAVDSVRVIDGPRTIVYAAGEWRGYFGDREVERFGEAVNPEAAARAWLEETT